MKEQQRPQDTDGLGIGDVSRICRVPVHTIRYWEREFGDFLTPSRTTGRQRRYMDTDIRKLMQIRKLLWTEGFSIRGAKRILSGTQIAPDTTGTRAVDSTDMHDLAMQIARFVSQRLAVAEIG